MHVDRSVPDATSAASRSERPCTDLGGLGGHGTYRWYQEMTIACPTNDEHTPECLQNKCLGDHDGCTLGSHPYRLPLVQTQADTDAGLRRAEYARQLPPDTNGYARTFGRRPPAESDNSQRESRYTWKRIPAYGDDQQSLIMLLGSLLENSKSRWHYQRLHATPRPPPDQRHTTSAPTPLARPPGTHPEAGRSAAWALSRPTRRQAY